MAQAAFVYSDRYLDYKFSESHPLQQKRLKMTVQILEALGHFDSGASDLIEPQRLATVDDLLRVHSEEYVDAVRRLSAGEALDSMRPFGFGRADNPPFPGMWEASLVYVGGTVECVRLVTAGGYKAAFNPAGGLHHAMRSKAAGFCTFNDCAIAADMLAEMGHKVAYIDIDAHHGDGTQALAYGRSDILTISIHETGQTLYPGTGFPGDSGEGDGVGYSVNIPLSPASTDCHFSWVFDELVTPILSAFAPTAVVLQVGADAHYADPLAHLALTTAGYEDMIRRVMALNLPTVVLGGGGYNLWAVPREYALCQGILAGVELPDDVPATIPGEWGIKYIRDRATPEIDAENMKDIWHYAHTTAKALKEMVFPIHGLS